MSVSQREREMKDFTDKTNIFKLFCYEMTLDIFTKFTLFFCFCFDFV